MFFEIPAQKPVEKPNFLSGALQKNQTMDLFDDYEDDSYAVSNDNGRVMTSTMDIHETVASSAKLNDAVDKPLGLYLIVSISCLITNPVIQRHISLMALILNVL